MLITYLSKHLLHTTIPELIHCVGSPLQSSIIILMHHYLPLNSRKQAFRRNWKKKEPLKKVRRFNRNGLHYYSGCHLINHQHWMNNLLVFNGECSTIAIQWWKPQSVMVFKNVHYSGIFFHVVNLDILHDIDHM